MNNDGDTDLFERHCSSTGWGTKPAKFSVLSGQSYNGSTIVNYDSRVVPDWKIPHITTLEP